MKWGDYLISMNACTDFPRLTRSDQQLYIFVRVSLKLAAVLQISRIGQSLSIYVRSLDDPNP